MNTQKNRLRQEWTTSEIDPHSVLHSRVSKGHYPFIMAALKMGPVVVLFCVSFSVCLLVITEGKYWPQWSCVQHERSVSSFSLIHFHFLSRTCQCWRITTGALQSACSGNQGFSLTCQRKWRKSCRDETYWCPHIRDKPPSLGHARLRPPGFMVASQLAALPACAPYCLLEEIRCQSLQPRNQTLSASFERALDHLWPNVRKKRINSSPLSHSSASTLCFAKFLSFMLTKSSSCVDPNNKYLSQRNTGLLKLVLRLVQLKKKKKD